MKLLPGQLILDIEKCREEMVELAKNSSYSSKKVVDLSTKLDRLLNKYYAITEKNKP
ncbi:MAG TPA: aspartyl-phosphate phosphatase Spo0E family protein [Pseudoneobacillus sp.]|nr:aspartyl-phosphate phosphatase Spo0E family protein [Pseudoneobacillus sp.]